MAGFFLNIRIPPNPLICNNLSLQRLFSAIPPKAKIFFLFLMAILLNLYRSKYVLDFST